MDQNTLAIGKKHYYCVSPSNRVFSPYYYVYESNNFVEEEGEIRLTFAVMSHHILWHIVLDPAVPIAISPLFRTVFYKPPV